MGNEHDVRQVRIVVVDDHEMVRIGLRYLLEKLPGMCIVGEADDGRAAIQLAQDLSPELILMDITMPGLNGIEATREIRKVAPDTKVIAVSMYLDRQFIAESLKAGASGYLLKNSAAREVGLAIEAVVGGRVYLSPRVAELVVDNYVRHPVSQSETAFNVLTSREREVLQLLAEGKTNKEIASDLFLGTKTVETHRAQLMDKLKIQTVAGLTKYAVRHGLTPLEV